MNINEYQQAFKRMSPEIVHKQEASIANKACVAVQNLEEESLCWQRGAMTYVATLAVCTTEIWSASGPHQLHIF